MLHSPDHVHPRDVTEFNPKDRAIIALIDEALETPEPVRRPGEIGSVLVRFTTSIDMLPEAS